MSKQLTTDKQLIEEQQAAIEAIRQSVLTHILDQAEPLHKRYPNIRLEWTIVIEGIPLGEDGEPLKQDGQEIGSHSESKEPPLALTYPITYPLKAAWFLGQGHEIVYRDGLYEMIISPQENQPGVMLSISLIGETYIQETFDSLDQCEQFLADKNLITITGWLPKALVDRHDACDTPQGINPRCFCHSSVRAFRRHRD